VGTCTLRMRTDRKTKEQAGHLPGVPGNDRSACNLRRKWCASHIFDGKTQPRRVNPLPVNKRYSYDFASPSKMPQSVRSKFASRLKDFTAIAPSEVGSRRKLTRPAGNLWRNAIRENSDPLQTRSPRSVRRTGESRIFAASDFSPHEKRPRVFCRLEASVITWKTLPSRTRSQPRNPLGFPLEERTSRRTDPWRGSSRRASLKNVLKRIQERALRHSVPARESSSDRKQAGKPHGGVHYVQNGPFRKRSLALHVS